jgi:hypothetical protein
MALHHTLDPILSPSELVIFYGTPILENDPQHPLDPILSPSELVIFYGTPILQNGPSPPRWTPS